MQLSLIKTVHYWLKHFDLLRRSLFGEIKMIAQCLSKFMWFLIREFKIILWRRWLNDAVWIILAQEWALSNLITAVLNIWSFFK
jgi:hypothetical protein